MVLYFSIEESMNHKWNYTYSIYLSAIDLTCLTQFFAMASIWSISPTFNTKLYTELPAEYHLQ